MLLTRYESRNRNNQFSPNLHKYKERALLFVFNAKIMTTITKDDEPKQKYKFTVVPESKLAPFTDHFPFYKEGIACSDPGGFILSPEFGRHVDKFINFQPREDDTWVVTFPKCGTTWTQEMVWMIINNCDQEAAKETPLTYRSPFLELSCMEKFMPKELLDVMPPVDVIDKMPSPRVIKSHLPFYLLPPLLLDTCKVVYVARNPKDVLVSYYHHHRLITMVSYAGNLESFAEHFMKDQLFFCPFFPHLLDAWSKRHHPNMLFLFYEDMKKDLRGEIEKVAKFLGKPLTEEQLTQLREHLKVDNFAKNESANFEIGKKVGMMNADKGNFVRKGKTGDWKNYISPELNSRLDEWIEKNLAGSDLKFVTELEHQD